MSILENLSASIAERPSKAITSNERAALDAEAGRELGIARASQGREELVQAARRVARTLAANGPVTIEDVCDEMARHNYPVWPGAKDNPQNWKGAVFNTPEFVCVGSLRSRKATSNGRHVRQWALKDWLRKNSMNGTSGTRSAFDFARIYNDFVHEMRASPDEMAWLVGTDLLSSEFAGQVKSGRIFGVSVIPFDGVGAILTRKDRVPSCLLPL